MTSLAEVYEDARNESLRRLYLGTGLFVAGAILVVLGILFATTSVLAGLGVGLLAAREIAGVLAGLGVPAVFVGIFTVLPADPRERSAAAIGASVAVFGVALFVYAYPERWYGVTPDHLTLPVAVVYFLGTLTTFWALFTAVVNFKTRNDPGGTVTLERVVEGQTRRVEVPVSQLDGQTVDADGLGGIGVLGDVDRAAVVEESAERLDDEGSTAASDGGTADRVGGSSGSTPRPARGRPADEDRYCGTCDHFEYVRTDRGIQPYCGYHDEAMDDMDPCDAWTRDSL